MPRSRKTSGAFLTNFSARFSVLRHMRLHELLYQFRLLRVFEALFRVAAWGG